jgi:hypothetical protein
MTSKELKELIKLTHRYIHGRMGPKDLERYRELVKKRDDDAVAKLRKLEEKKLGRA